MRGLEQKSVLWMKDLAGKLTRKGNFGMDYSAGTCPATEACMLLDRRRRSAGCDLDSDVLSIAKPDLISTFVLQVLNRKSDIEDDEQLKTAAPVVRKERGGFRLQKKTTREPPLGLDMTQMMPRCTLHFLSTLYGKYGLYEKFRHNLLSVRSSMWTSRL